MIRGVRISCDWDRWVLGKAKYIDVMVPRDDPVFNDFTAHNFEPVYGRNMATPSCSLSLLSVRAGLAFHVRKIPPNPSLPGQDAFRSQDPGAGNRLKNEEATSLLKGMNPEVPKGWNRVVWFWDFDVGNVLITRVDGEVITPQQVEALCAYSIYLSNGPMREAEKAHEEDNTRQKTLAYRQVVKKVTPAKFHEFYDIYGSIQGKGLDWEDNNSDDPVIMHSDTIAEMIDRWQGPQGTTITAEDVSVDRGNHGL